MEAINYERQDDCVCIPPVLDISLRLYDSCNKYIGDVQTIDQYYEIRCQIKERVLGGGYYFKAKNDERIDIDEVGRLRRSDVDKLPFDLSDWLDRLMS